MEAPATGAASIEFEVTSNGRAVLERQFGGTSHEMITVYLACLRPAAGEPLLCDGQPAGLSRWPTHRRPRDIRMEFVGGTGLDPRQDHHANGERIEVRRSGRTARRVPVPQRARSRRRAPRCGSASAVTPPQSSAPHPRPSPEPAPWITDCAAGNAAPRWPTTRCRCGGSRNVAPAGPSCTRAACASSTTPARRSTVARPIAEEVKDKQAANFCDYFRPTPAAYQPAALQRRGQGQGRTRGAVRRANEDQETEL